MLEVLHNSAYIMHCHGSLIQLNSSKSTRPSLNFVLFFAKVTLPTTNPERMNLKTVKEVKLLIRFNNQ